MLGVIVYSSNVTSKGALQTSKPAHHFQPRCSFSNTFANGLYVLVNDSGVMECHSHSPRAPRNQIENPQSEPTAIERLSHQALGCLQIGLYLLQLASQALAAGRAQKFSRQSIGLANPKRPMSASRPELAPLPITGHFGSFLRAKGQAWQVQRTRPVWCHKNKCFVISSGSEPLVVVIIMVVAMSVVMTMMIVVLVVMVIVMILVFVIVISNNVKTKHDRTYKDEHHSKSSCSPKNSEWFLHSWNNTIPTIFSPELASKSPVQVGF